MLHLYHDLKREESQQLIRRLSEIETTQFELVLWQALTCCQIDWWLSNSKDISLLDGAIQFVHHCSSVLYLAEFDTRDTAHMLGLLTSEERRILREALGAARVDENGLLTYRQQL